MKVYFTSTLTAKLIGNITTDHYLGQQELGIRVLMHLPPRLQEVYEDHRNFPELIFESLVCVLIFLLHL